MRRRSSKAKQNQVAETVAAPPLPEVAAPVAVAASEVPAPKPKRSRSGGRRSSKSAASPDKVNQPETAEKSAPVAAPETAGKGRAPKQAGAANKGGSGTSSKQAETANKGSSGTSSKQAEAAGKGGSGTSSKQAETAGKGGFGAVARLTERDYISPLRKLAGGAVDKRTVDDYVDFQWAKRNVFYDERGNSASESAARIMLFDTGYSKRENGRRLMGGFVRVTPKAAWQGVFVEEQEALLARLRERIQPTKAPGGTTSEYYVACIYFAGQEQAEGFLSRVAKKAMEETWEFGEGGREKFPVLRHYLCETIYRLLDLERDDKNACYLRRAAHQACFHTGLFDNYFRPIIISVRTEESRGGEERWTNPELLPIGNDSRVQFGGEFVEIPSPARYITSLDDVLYDPDLPINYYDEHIILDGLQRDRFPTYTAAWRAAAETPAQTNIIHQVLGDVQIAVERAKLMARQDYKFVVPQYNRSGGLQFLLPLYFGSFSEVPECALVLRRVRLPSGSAYYEAVTVLKPTWAYGNARLIARMNTFWLGRLENT